MSSLRCSPTPAAGRFDVGLVLDRPAEEAVAEIERFLQGCANAEVVLLYLLGVVIVDHAGDTYLAAIDTRPSALRTSAVATSRISEALDTSEERLQVAVLDCVVVGDGSGAGAGRLASADVRRAARSVVRQLGHERGIVVAAGAVEPSPVHEPPEPTFTSHVVRGLRSGAADLDGDRYLIDARDLRSGEVWQPPRRRTDREC